MGSITFPPTFTPSTWQGPRSLDHVHREDAFQQLVGDGFKLVFGESAHIIPTSGRDGSIDIWIEGANSANRKLFGMEFPVIAECKDHDDTLPRFHENVRQGWRSVAERLSENARKGWSGAYSPWKHAHGYLYCVSGTFRDVHSKLKLESAILEFFRELPDDVRPPIENVRVLDWSDLRAWFDELPVLSDRWLGVGLELILPLHAYFRTLTGFQEYLQEETLPFVPPPPDMIFHPSKILDAIESQAGKGGVLIHGPGGIGKTRTAFEVARLAESSGWRVLYALPGEPGIDLETLASAVLSRRQKTLIVTDYLDQAHRLDIGALRRQLLPQSLDQGTPIAILATSRPGWLIEENIDRDELFSIQIPVEPSAYQRNRIVDQMLEVAAPSAKEAIGRKSIREICGSRPILALLIARELEKVVLRGDWSPDETSKIRKGDLVYWLRRRFTEDGILVTAPSSPFRSSVAEPEVLAVAAVLSCTPRERSALVDAARITLGFLEAADLINPEHIVYTLERLGWIESRQLRLAVVHDVVTDELLDRILFDTTMVRANFLEAVLEPGTLSARSFGRQVTAVRRLLSGIEPARIDVFMTALEQWIRGRAPKLSNTLRIEDLDVASYALGAALDGPPWLSLVMLYWDEIVLPLVFGNEEADALKHLYYRGLRSLPLNSANLISRAANQWLKAHPKNLDSSFVLGPLLTRRDLEAVEARQAVLATFDWLAGYTTAQGAEFVIPPLLARTDLEVGDARQAVSAAFVWLAEHTTAPGAGFVLNPLLARTDLEAVETRQAVSAAFDWLAENKSKQEAQFVLQPLLARTDLEAVEARHAVSATLVWLAEHKSQQNAQFVLYPLLARTDLEAVEARQAVSAAFVWLAEHTTTLVARFVLDPLLARADLEAVEARRAISTTFTWLSEHITALEAGFVLPRLLARTDLNSEEERLASQRAFIWLEDNYLSEDAEFVVRGLLRNRGLSDEDHNRAAELAIRRLQSILLTPEATFLLRNLLGDKQIAIPLNLKVAKLGLEWLSANPGHNSADFVFNRILRNRNIEDAAWKIAAGHAFDWLSSHSKVEELDWVLFSLLTRPRFLSQEQLRQIVDVSINFRGPSQLIERLFLRLEHVVRGTLFHDTVLMELSNRGLTPKN